MKQVFSETKACEPIERILDSCRDVDRATGLSIINSIIESDDLFSPVLQLLIDKRSSCTAIKCFSLLALDELIKGNWCSLPQSCRLNTRRSLLMFQKEFASSSDLDRLAFAKVSEALLHVFEYEFPQKWPNFFNDLFSEFDSESQLMNPLLFISTIADEARTENGINSRFRRGGLLFLSLREYFPSILCFMEAVLLNNQCEYSVMSVLNLYAKLVPLMEEEDLFSGDVLNIIFDLILPDKAFTSASMDVAEQISNYPKVSNDSIISVTDSFNLLIRSTQKVFCEDFSETSPQSDIISSYCVSIPQLLTKYGASIRARFPDAFNCAISTLQLITKQSNGANFESCIPFWAFFMHNFNQQPDYSFVAELSRILILNFPNPYSFDANKDSSIYLRMKSNISQCDDSSFPDARDCLSSIVSIDHSSVINTFNEILCSIKTEILAADRLCHLCWSIGSVTGSLTNEEEAAFIPGFLNSVYSVNSVYSEVADQFSVASGIIYICSQSSLFAKQPLLDTLPAKIEECLCQNSDELQSFSIETLKTLCRRISTPAIIECLLNIIHKIHRCCIIEYISVLASMIQNLKNGDDKSGLAQILLQYVTSSFQLSDFVISDQECNLSLIISLKSVNKCLVHLSAFAMPVFESLIPSLCTLITAYSGLNPIEDCQMIAKNEIISLFDTALSSSDSPDYMRNLYFPDIIVFLLNDFETNQDSRSSSVLNLLCTLSTKLPTSVQENFDLIYSKAIQPAWQSISTSTSKLFFRLLRVIVRWCIPVFFSIDPEKLSTIIGALGWGCYQNHDEISEECPLILADLISCFEAKSKEKEFSEFSALVSLPLTTFTLKLIAEEGHAFHDQIELLRKLFQNNETRANLESIVSFLSEEYPNLSSAEHFLSLSRLFDACREFDQFKEAVSFFVDHLRMIPFGGSFADRRSVREAVTPPFRWVDDIIAAET